MNPLVTYSLARLALFVVTLGLLVLAGAGQIWAVVLAAAISMLLSYVLLRPLRDRAADRVADRIAHRTAASSTTDGPDEQAEDAEVERSLAEAEQGASAEQQPKAE